MKQNQQKSRHNALWAVILCYLLPFIGLSSIGAFMGRAPKGWFLLCAALLLSSIGSLILYWFLAKWELSKKHPFDITQNISTSSTEQPQPIVEEKTLPNIPSIDDAKNILNEELVLSTQKALDESKQFNDQLQLELSSLNSLITQLNQEKEQSSEKLNNALNDLEIYKHTCKQQQEEYKIYINELHDQLEEQKQQVEKKQYQISHLETKVGDLTYEIKTLLQIAERHLPSASDSNQHLITKEGDALPLPQEQKANEIQEKSVNSSENASIQLKRCIDIAQKITGSNRFNSQISSFLDSHSDNFTLDLRRLCDTLRSENTNTIILYSPKENQPLFVSNHIRENTGWSPEKFVQNFNEIIQDSMSDWRQGLNALSLRSETALQLSLKTRSGSNISLKANLGLIPTGIFRHYAIAILH